MSDEIVYPAMVDCALAYARIGWHVFALQPRSKEPYPGSAAQHDATTDEARIRAMWADDRADSNIGLALEPSGLMAFDVDEYHGDHLKLAGLFERLGPLPNSLGHTSGSGQGHHFIYRRPPFQLRGAVDGVVLRGKNYIVLAPSIHPSGGRYMWKSGFGPGEVYAAELPPAWLEAVKKTTKVAALDIADDEPEWLASIPQDKRVADMRRHLDRELGEVHPSFAKPDTDQRRIRPSMMFTVACTAVREYAVRDPEQVLDGLREIYNLKCLPPYSDDKLARAVYSAYTRGEKAWGERYNPAALPQDPEMDEHLAEVVEATIAPAPVPVTSTRVRSELEAARDKLKRSTNGEKKHAGNLLSRVLKAEVMSDLREFVEAANFVARCLPSGADTDQFRNVMLPCAGGALVDLLPEVVRRAIEHAQAAPALVVATRAAAPESLEALLMPDQALADMNEKYAWVEGVGCVVDTTDEEVEYRKLEVFKTTYGNRKVLDGEEPEALGTWWLKNPGRRSYRHVGLWAPPIAPPENALNLWRGFAIEPTPGDWSMMRAHIRDIIAAGSAELDEYIVRWIAWALQNPGERAGAAVVLRGGEGTGKGTLGNALVDIFGPHAQHVINSEHFVGRFNKHMAECSFFFADECYYAGDRHHENVLKGLITEPTILVEPKGVDTFKVLNQLHIMMSSNSDWIVPAGADARRFVVSDVSTARQGQIGPGQYFDKLSKEIQAGGLAAMLHDMLHMDLGTWHPRQIVDSDALRDQKERSLGPEGEWTLALVREAELPRVSRAMPSGGVSTYVSFDEIRMHAQQTSPRARWTDKLIGLALTKIGVTNKREHGTRGRVFPDLATARSLWCKNYFNYAFDDTSSWH